MSNPHERKAWAKSRLVWAGLVGLGVVLQLVVNSTILADRVAEPAPDRHVAEITESRMAPSPTANSHTSPFLPVLANGEGEPVPAPRAADSWEPRGSAPSLNANTEKFPLPPRRADGEGEPLREASRLRPLITREPLLEIDQVPSSQRDEDLDTLLDIARRHGAL